VAGYRTVTRKRLKGYRTVKKREIVGWRTVAIPPAGTYVSRFKGVRLATPVLSGEQPSEPYTPLPGSPEAALLKGDLVVPGKTPQVVHEPPPASSQPVDLAAWKQADYQGVAAYQAAMRADEAFDAEVSGLTPEEWYQAQQRAVTLRIEQAQQQAEKACAQYGKGSLECAQAWQWANQAIEAITREAALQPQVPSPEPPPLLPPIRLPEAAQSRPYTQTQWMQFHQTQTGEDDCNAFALAMAHNLLYADDPDHWLTGDEVQERIEHHLGWVPASRWTWLRWRVKHLYLSQVLFPSPMLLPNKMPGLGVPTWQYDNAVHQILPDAQVEHLTGATPEDLKRAIAEGKIVIVAVGWDSNSGIVWKFVKSKWDKWRGNPNPQQPSTIGHYMVVVGYDAEHVYVLNPSYNPAKVKAPSFPQQIPWKQFLRDWSQGNFAIEAKSLWAIEQEAGK